MEPSTYGPHAEKYREWGWRFSISVEWQGRDQMFVLSRLDDSNSPFQRTRAHAFSEPDDRSRDPRYRLTFRLDPDVHSSVEWIVFFLVGADKVYRFSRAGFDALVARAESRGFGWIYDPERGYRANLYTRTDELHPVGEDGNANPAFARLDIREFLEPRGD